MATTAEQVGVLETRLASANARLVQTQIAAQLASEEHNQAVVDLEEAAAAATSARGAADRARDELVVARAAIGSLAAASYRRGGSLAGLEAVLAPGGPQELMDRAGTLSYLGNGQQRIYQRGQAAELVSQLLDEQAQTARTAQEDASLRAEEARQEAERTSLAAQALVDATEVEKTSLVTQLAALRNTSVELESARQAGLEAERAARAEAAARAAAEQREAEERAAAESAAADRAARDQAARAEAAQREAAEQAAAVLAAADRDAADRAAAERGAERAAADREAAERGAERDAADRAAADRAERDAADRAAADRAAAEQAAAERAAAERAARDRASRDQPRPPPARPAPAPAPPAAPAPAPAPAPDPVGPSLGSSSAGEAAVSWARGQVGKPYQWGGTGPNSFDCSGLTGGAWRNGGVSLPRTSRDQYRAVSKIPHSQLRPGDLVFYGSGNDADSIYHVAIYSGGGRMIEAARAGIPVRETALRMSGAMDYAGRP